MIKVENGKIRLHNGRVLDKLAIIYDVAGTAYKWGEDDDEFRAFYDDIMKRCKAVNLDNIYSYISFDDSLTLDEVCTFGNYIVKVSANGDKIRRMLNMSLNELKFEIAKLKELGY